LFLLFILALSAPRTRFLLGLVRSSATSDKDDDTATTTIILAVLKTIFMFILPPRGRVRTSMLPRRSCVLGRFWPGSGGIFILALNEARPRFMEGIPKCFCWPSVFGGGQGYQGHNTSHVHETSGLLAWKCVRFFRFGTPGLQMTTRPAKTFRDPSEH
jgi:hypothetical protein